MVGEVVVGDGDVIGGFDGTDEVGGAICKVQVVKPHVGGSEDADGATIRAQAVAIVCG